MALVPTLQDIFGFDVWNPREVVPEFRRPWSLASQALRGHKLSSCVQSPKSKDGARGPPESGCGRGG